MGIPLAFDVENIYFINDYDLEKGIVEYIDFVREHNPFLVELSNKDS